MQRDLDFVDVLVAIGLAASIVIWAFLWAYPYPHPDQWPFLATFGHHLPLRALSVVGKVALGVFAALVYFVLRGTWIRFRDEADELPDKFFFTRFSPLCGAAIFALSPFAWHAAQFLSPGFALIVLSLCAVFLWQRGCGYRNLLFACTAYLLQAFVSGLNPLGFAVLAYFTACDVLRRWEIGLEYGQREDDAEFRRKLSIEMSLTFAGGLVGFGLAILCGTIYFSEGEASDGFVSGVITWWHGWLAACDALIRTVDTVALVGGVGLAAALQALGRRLRAIGPRASSLAVTLACILALTGVAFFLRAVDSDERVRLALMRDYVRGVLTDAEGAMWLFTDGRFDDALRFEAKRRGIALCVLDALTPPSAKTTARLRTLAPEPADVAVFAAGGAEVFKAWAHERPDRLERSAWQLGTSVVRRFDKVKVRSHGSVIRTDDEATRSAAQQADSRFVQLTREVQGLVERPSPPVPVFGTVDETVAYLFDSLVWRAARMAGERSDAAGRTGEAKVAQEERVSMQKLDAANATLRAQGNVIERLLPTASLVLTSREALKVSLERADFALAQRYAQEVLVSAPDDPSAHFALGMASLEAGDCFAASRHFERVLKSRPNEPATLNNLSLAYLKLGKLSEALETVNRALKANPNSAEVKKNLAAIRKAMKE